MFAAGETVGLVAWIIDDTCLVFLILFEFGGQEQIYVLLTSAKKRLKTFEFKLYSFFQEDSKKRPVRLLPMHNLYNRNTTRGLYWLLTRETSRESLKHALYYGKS